MSSLYEIELARYQTDGYAVFHNVIDVALIAELRAHVEWLQRRIPAASQIPSCSNCIG